MKTRLAEKSSARIRSGDSKPGVKSGEGAKVEKSVVINRPPDEVYPFWRQLENLPRFMKHIQSVTQVGTTTSHWAVKTSHDHTLEWDAQIIEDKPGQMISWQSLPGAEMHNAGSVWFIPTSDGRGTVVKVSMKYSPPGGKLAIVMAKLFGDRADQEMEEDLQRLKVLLETGEMPRKEEQSGAM